jgi:protein ImuA
MFLFCSLSGCAMSPINQQQRLAALRDTIAQIERKPALAEARQRVEAEGDEFPVLAGGLLQEIFTDDRRNAGASLGFALGQARGLLSPKRLAVIYVQLADEAQKLGLPYGPGLLSFGFDPQAMILVRAASIAELLWVAEEAISCRAVAAVVGDVGSHSKLLDFTASRRLSLRAAEAGSTMFLLRYGTGREASAAQLRWHLLPRDSGHKAYDDRAPGGARWLVRLERGSLIKQHAEWVLGWTENGFSSFTPRSDPDVRINQSAPFHGAVPSQLGHRLSEAS